MLKEFREFIMRGNVLDLAIAIVIGTAFTAVINSLVNDIIMPVVGRVTGGVNFVDLFINLSGGNYPSLAAAKDAGAATINYGVFINTIIIFIIVAFVMFMIVKAANRLHKEPKPGEPTEKSCPYCKSKIAVDATRCAYCTSQL